ncbi:MAG: peptide chain release factor N(5)-glutamine methyltransferase [Phycisphaera sp.]|nr:peptide chain release factor N(5)-glutamine methyltransferase [Phycisphaera sp.]
MSSPKAPAGDAAAPTRWTVRALLAWIVPYLQERSVDSPRAVAEILLAEVLRVERLGLYMEPERELDPQELAALRALVARAGRHEPVQFLVGRWPFLGRDFAVAPCTLIPRPSTETLVTRALDWYRARCAEGDSSARVLDLCTGSGCIAVSIALGMRAIARPEGLGCKPISAGAKGAEGAEAEVVARVISSPDSGEQQSAPAVSADAARRRASMTASDIVPEAVELARGNAARHGVEIDFRTGDLFAAVRPDERFDLIASNPPYVTDEEYAALDANVRDYEPAIALRGGRDGLDLVRRIVAGAERHLARGGLLLVEVGWKHRASALALVAGSAWRDAEILVDGEGIDRVLVAVRSGLDG